MTGCGCCIELDTLQTILDEGNDYYDAGTDLIDEVFTEHGGTFEYGDMMQQALWWRYRDLCIGSCNTPKWVRGMADRLGLIGAKWDSVFAKYDEQFTELTDLTDRSYERIIQRTAMDGTDGDVTTLSHTGQNTHVMKHESLPQTATTATEYLDARQTDTDTPGVTDTNAYKPNTQDKEIYKADDTIPAITFSDMMNNYPNVLLGFVNEFAEYFVNRWYC